MLMLLSVCQVSASSSQEQKNSMNSTDQNFDELNKQTQQFVDQAKKEAGKVAQVAVKATEQVVEDSGNMIHDFIATFRGMKNPMIQTTRATLKLQNKQYPGASESFHKKAVSPYYAPAFISFIAGSTLLVTSLFSKDKKTLWTGSGLCFATALGCYYKSRSDIIAVRKSVIDDAVAAREKIATKVEATK